MYILTYATHNERYFPYLERNKEINVLGMGKKWNGFRDKVNAIVDFTKKCNDNDLILFVDGFDSIVLGKSLEIEERYKNLKKKHNFDILFSKDNNAKNFLTKIIQDKYFGSCNTVNLNSGIYMGTAKIIRKSKASRYYQKKPKTFFTTNRKHRNI